MDEKNWLAGEFEANRAHLGAVAYRMLGSRAEADDAVQEAWLRLGRSDADAIDNIGGWLTTVVARICLDMLRSRKTRREEPFDLPVHERVADTSKTVDPEREVAFADSVGMALLVILETLAPAERVAFVLHDMFDLPFDDIAPIIHRSSAATRQLASRARRRVQGKTDVPEADAARPPGQRPSGRIAPDAVRDQPRVDIDAVAFGADAVAGSRCDALHQRRVERQVGAAGGHPARGRRRPGDRNIPNPKRRR